MDITIALQRAVRAFPLGTKALAARLGISETSLSHKVSPTYLTAHCSPQELLEIMEVTGDHGPLNGLAEALGYVLMPSPSAVDGDAPPARALARSIREFGEFISTAADAVDDGRVTANELSRIEREGADALAAIQHLLRAARELHEQSVPASLRKVA